MKSHNPLKKTLSALVATGFALSIMTAQAVTVSPAKAELTADPGETITSTFIIINEQDTEQTFYTSVENFESSGETGTPNFTSSKEGLPSWIQVQEKVILKKGERVSVPYTVVVPQGADAGGHFAAIFLSTVPPSAKEGEVSVGAKVGMLVFLKVTGNVKEQGGLIELMIKEGKKVLTNLPVDFVYRFRNEGNDRVKPEGEIVIKNTFGMEVARLNANESGGNILPGSVRRFEVHLGAKEGPAVSAPFFDHVSYQMNNFALGMYTATINLSFGNAGKADLSLTYFMLPWQLLSIIGGAVLLTIIILLVLVKHYNRWIIKQAQAAAK
jgi:hypothetical protein